MLIIRLEEALFTQTNSGLNTLSATSEYFSSHKDRRSRSSQLKVYRVSETF